MLGSCNGSQCRRVVLLAEDDDDVRSWLCELLVAQDYEVLTARNGFDALLVADEYGKDIDLLLTDLDMPVIDGLTLAQIMIRVGPAPKLVFMSGSALSEQGLGDGLDFEAVLIQKPFEEEVLLREVKRVLLVGNDQG